MKKIIMLLSMLCSVITVTLLNTSCTDNERARNYGGTETINLPANEKVMNVTWKEQNLWVLTRPMHPSDSAETVVFQEKSSYGVYEGKIIIVESKN